MWKITNQKQSHRRQGKERGKGDTQDVSSGKHKPSAHKECFAGEHEDEERRCPVDEQAHNDGKFDPERIFGKRKFTETR